MGPRPIAAFVLVGAVVLLGIAAFAESWWVWPQGDGGAGLLGLKSCDSFSNRCESVSYSALANSSARDASEVTRLLWAGRLAFGTTLVTALAAGVLLLQILMGQGGDGTYVRSFAGLAAAATVAVVATAPSAFEPFSFGLGFYLEWLGLGLAALGEFAGAQAKTTSTSPAPLQQAMTPPPPVDTGFHTPPPSPPAQVVQSLAYGHSQTNGGPVPGCPTCRAPTEFAAQFGRYYCARCNHYL